MTFDRFRNLTISMIFWRVHMNGVSCNSSTDRRSNPNSTQREINLLGNFDKSRLLVEQGPRCWLRQEASRINTCGLANFCIEVFAQHLVQVHQIRHMDLAHLTQLAIVSTPGPLSWGRSSRSGSIILSCAHTSAVWIFATTSSMRSASLARSISSA
eukprot:4334588-Amphidinium_carterae.2